MFVSVCGVCMCVGVFTPCVCVRGGVHAVSVCGVGGWVCAYLVCVRVVCVCLCVCV